MPTNTEPVDPPVRRTLTMPLLPAAGPPDTTHGWQGGESLLHGHDGDVITGASNAELGALLRFAEGNVLNGEIRPASELLLETAVSTYGFARGAVLLGEHHLAIIAGHALAGDPPSSGVSLAVRSAQSAAAQQVVTVAPELEPWLSQFAPAHAELLLQPLIYQHRRLGALILQVPSALQAQQRPAVFKRVAKLAAMTSVVIHGDQRLQQLQRLAATDDLTMIANRRSFDASIEREMARALRSGEPLSLAVLDLDLFKQVNDVYGHPAGDDLLRNVAAALVGACRELDTPARYGGEEFAVILPDCPTERSLLIVERLRLAVAAAPGVTRITASAGVATFPDSASTVDQLIAAADQALLEAKRAGRNQTHRAASSPHERA